MPGPVKRRRGLTLLELVIVLAGIAILLALLVPAVQKIRAGAARAQCSNNLKEIGLACHAAHGVYGRMPPAFGFYPESSIYNGSDGLGTVFFHLLPYVDQEALYQQSHYQPAYRPQQNFYFYTANNVAETQVPSDWLEKILRSAGRTENCAGAVPPPAPCRPIRRWRCSDPLK